MINFSDEKSLPTVVKLEKKSLKATLDIQKSLNKQILLFMKNFIGKLELTLDFNPNNKVFQYLNESTSALNKSNENIQALQKLLTNLEEIENDKKSLSNNNISSRQFKSKVKAYNTQYIEQIDMIYDNTSYIEDFIHNISKIDIVELLNELNNVKKTKTVSTSKNKKSVTISSDELNSSLIENTLIISEIQGIVILPYKIEKIKEILLENNEKYKSMEEVIQKVFTIPISHYKIPSIARFRETYKLMVEREKTSKIKALSLASELFANYNLHPAIITACQTLDELDIYLACLEDNMLDDFQFFDIKYEIPPTISKIKTNDI